MSQENVEIIKALIPPPEVDLAPLFRDDGIFEQTVAALESIVDPEVEARAAWQGSAARSYFGIEGFRQFWLDWLEPWAAYHTQVEELIDAGDRVVVLIRDRARRHDTDAEVDLLAGSVWELREGRIVRAEFFRNQDDALAAAGLSE